MENRSMTDNNMAMGVTMPEIGKEDIRDRNSTLSRTFSAVKWFLALTVVADHFFRLLVIKNPGGEYSFLEYPFVNEIALFVSSYLRNFAVPIFFFMSGYLLYTGDNYSFKTYKPILKRKLSGLFKPYVIWWCIGLVVMLIFTIVMIYGLGSSPEISSLYTDEGFNIPRVIAKLIGFGAHPEANRSLWFIRDLMFALCVVPVIQWIIRYVDWRYVIMALAVIFVAIFHDQRGIRFEVVALFFTTGYLMRAKDVNIVVLSKRIFPYAAVLYVLIGALFIYAFCANPDNLRIICVAKNISIILTVPLVIYLFYYLVSRNVIAGSAFLASASFFIFVAHFPLCDVIYHASFGIFQPEPGSIAGTMVLIGSFLFLIFFLLGVYYMLDRYFPRVKRFLSAGR